MNLIQSEVAPQGWNIGAWTRLHTVEAPPSRLQSFFRRTTPHRLFLKCIVLPEFPGKHPNSEVWASQDAVCARRSGAYELHPMHPSNGRSRIPRKSRENIWIRRPGIDAVCARRSGRCELHPMHPSNVWGQPLDQTYHRLNVNTPISRHQIFANVFSLYCNNNQVHVPRCHDFSVSKAWNHDVAIFSAKSDYYR